VDLLLGGVEGQVADVEGGGVLELLLGLWAGAVVVVVVVAVAVASALLGGRVSWVVGATGIGGERTFAVA
jgi:hypothetical protein